MTPVQIKALVERLSKVNPWRDLDWPEVLRSAASALAQMAAERDELAQRYHEMTSWWMDERERRVSAEAQMEKSK